MMSKLKVSALLVSTYILTLACNEARFVPTNKDRRAQIAAGPQCQVQEPSFRATPCYFSKKC